MRGCNEVDEVGEEFPKVHEASASAQSTSYAK